MPHLPAIVWIAAAGYSSLLIALCVLTVTIAIRRARARWSHWAPRRILAFLLVAALPWVIAWLAPIRITAKINGTLQLSAWLLVALLVFAVLVPLPLAAIVASAIWWRERRQQGRHEETSGNV
jgi:hypothetical protein